MIPSLVALSHYPLLAPPLLLSLVMVAQTVKNLPAMQETQVRSLGREDSLEKGRATHFSIPWRIPWTIQLQRVRQD